MAPNGIGWAATFTTGWGPHLPFWTTGKETKSLPRARAGG